MSPPSGTLASHLQPRLVVMVAVMAVLVCLSTVLAAGTILYNQLDDELDAAQVRQGRDGAGMEGDIVPGIDTPGMRIGTVMTIELPNGSALGSVIEDGEVDSVTPEAVRLMADLPIDGTKRTLSLPGMGKYRVEARNTRLGEVSVGLPTQDIDRALLWLTLLSVSVSLVAVSATALVTREVLGRGTKPLVALTNTADEVSRLELERGAVEVPRVEVGAMPAGNEVTRLATAFNQMLSRVEQALGAREVSETKLRRFVADASHELRNPLAAIRGYAELAERSPDGAQSAFALGRIGAEAQRMSKLVGDLLLLARLDADAKVEPRPVDAVEVVLNAVSDAQAASPGHHWHLDLPDPAEVEVMADADQLHQMLVNLLSNARNHTPLGTTVTTSVRVADDAAIITVADDGPGIPPETLPRVFERFVRADDARAHTPAHSTGLGLAIVQAVVEGFGGTATVTSEPGNTRFTVTLPLSH